MHKIAAFLQNAKKYPRHLAMPGKMTCMMQFLFRHFAACAIRRRGGGQIVDKRCLSGGHVQDVYKRQAHTSAWAGLRQEIADLAAQETSGRLENTALITCAEEIARLSEDDRALYYYIEAFGLESGTDANIFDALATLPEYVEANFPDGLSLSLIHI